jgi:beta-glucosidase
MSSVSKSPFPADFAWGVATAAYQIEGAVDEDGRGESIWDRFAATPGKVRSGDTGAVACDFYHRFEADIELMRNLGVDAFRFSIAWPRVQPDGTGRINEAGLDFYDRLVDALLENGITPFATLYHWDLPQRLEERGGWPSRHIVDAFAEYTEAVAERLGDRVGHWITHNEPWVVAWLGYGWGMHAPGRTSERDALAAAHHLLVGHGRAVEILRRRSPEAKVGITLNLYDVYPASDTPEDVLAARYADGLHNRWFLDAILRGEYPLDMIESFGDAVPAVAEGDMEAASVPVDFVGVNYYSRHVIGAGRDGGRPVLVRNPESEYTDMGWEIYPEGLFRVLTRLRDDYAIPPVYITENGSAFSDVRRHDGSVDDLERLAYLESHIDALGRTVEEGVPVKGYFVWSLLDNFEWAHGYSKRFGIVYVDYPTLERVPKASYSWYRSFIRRQRERAGTGMATGLTRSGTRSRTD